MSESYFDIFGYRLPSLTHDDDVTDMNDDENAAKKRRTLRSTASASTSNLATGTTTRPATTAVKRDSLAAELERGE